MLRSTVSSPPPSDAFFFPDEFYVWGNTTYFKAWSLETAVLSKLKLNVLF